MLHIFACAQDVPRSPSETSLSLDRLQPRWQASVVAAPESAMHVNDLANIMAVHGGAPARAGMAVTEDPAEIETSARLENEICRC